MAHVIAGATAGAQHHGPRTRDAASPHDHVGRHPLGALEGAAALEAAIGMHVGAARARVPSGGAARVGEPKRAHWTLGR